MKTVDEIQEILEEKVNWKDVHHAYVDGDYGQRVEFWITEDGEVQLVTMDQNTFQPGVEIIGSLRCPGVGNMSLDYYSDGWTTGPDEEGRYTVTETGEVLEEMEMIHRCIDDGEWAHEYERWQEQLIESYRLDREREEIFGRD